MAALIPSTSTHPYIVGRMVYETLEEAKDRTQYASTRYPDLKVRIIDRRTNETVVTYLKGQEV